MVKRERNLWLSILLAATICLSLWFVVEPGLKARADWNPWNWGSSRTSTNSPQRENWNRLKSKRDINGKTFDAFSDGILDSAVIPGLETTHILDENGNSVACHDMAPQGVCMADGYMVICAYCTEDKSPHNSVLYVLKDGQYLETFVLTKEDGSPFVNHLGGMVYRDGMLYLPGNGDKCVYQVELAPLLNGVGRSDARKAVVTEAFRTGRTTSLLAEYGGMLYVGTFYHDSDQNQSTTLYGYDPANGWRHGGNDEITLPVIKVQGVAFLEREDGVYILASASYNRNTVSRLYSFKWDGERSLPRKKIYKQIQLPNMSEDLCLSGTDAWVLFESAAKKYQSGEILRPIDRVICFDTQSVTFDPYATGLVKGPDCEWGMYVNGYLDTSYNGVAQNEFGWYRVKNGYVDFNANGIYRNEYGWWKTTDGKVTFQETGVFKNECGWWRVVNSKVDFRANGIYQNRYGWWKTTDGKVTFKENGVFRNSYGWWKVKNSKVDFGFTGIAKNEYGQWYVKNGKVDFNKNGKVKYKDKTYEVVDGKAEVVE